MTNAVTEIDARRRLYFLRDSVRSRSSDRDASRERPRSGDENDYENDARAGSPTCGGQCGLTAEWSDLIPIRPEEEPRAAQLEHRSLLDASILPPSRSRVLP